MPGESIAKSRTKGPSGCSPIVIGFFVLLMAAIGLTAGWFITGRPLLRLSAARGWPASTCEVTSSQVGTNTSSDGETFFIDIKYRYDVDGRTYTSGRYDFVTGSDAARQSKADIIERYPAGRIFECFVNPADPADAIINREFRWAYLWGLIFVVMFAGIPLLVAAFTLPAMWRQRAGAAVPGMPGMPGMPSSSGISVSVPPSLVSSPGPGLPGGAVTLKPSSGPIGRLAMMLFICFFWNGIVGVFTYLEFSGGMEGSWFLALFLLPFQLIGLGLIWGVFHSLLALANPRVTLTLSSGAPALGSTIYADWQMKGAAGRIRTLTFSLEGHEEATYRQGTRTSTDRHQFFKAVLTETTDPQRIASGHHALEIPADTMHTFKADRNRIVWELKLHGAIARWPDVEETFEIELRPR